MRGLVGRSEMRAQMSVEILGLRHASFPVPFHYLGVDGHGNLDVMDSKRQSHAIRDSWGPALPSVGELPSIWPQEI